MWLVKKYLAFMKYMWNIFVGMNGVSLHMIKDDEDPETRINVVFICLTVNCERQHRDHWRDHLPVRLVSSFYGDFSNSFQVDIFHNQELSLLFLRLKSFCHIKVVCCSGLWHNFVGPRRKKFCKSREAPVDVLAQIKDIMIMRRFSVWGRPTLLESGWQEVFW